MRALQFQKAVYPVEEHARFITDAPKPKAEDLKKGDLLIRVYYASINPVDYKLMETPIVKWFVGKAPAIPAQDFCGHIEAIGAGTDRPDLKVGQMCYGRIDIGGQFGTLADYAVVKQDGCAALPDGIALESAAGFGCAGITAYQSVIPYAQANKKSDALNIFLNGGSGGVGTWAIQIAKVMGCKVTVTCSTANVELCKRLGADRVIDYKTSDVVKELCESSEKYDVAIDYVGQPEDVFWKAHLFLKKGAPFVQVGAPHFDFGVLVSFVKRAITPTFISGAPWSFIDVVNKVKDYDQAAQWLAEGAIKCEIQEIVDLEDGAAAFARLRTGRTKGKIIIKVASPTD